MSTIAIHRPGFLKFPRDEFRSHRKLIRIPASCSMMDSKSSSTTKKEQLSIQLPTPSFPQTDSLKSSDLKFDRLQPSDEELVQQDRFEFGKFVAREAALDEEYWTAAWLRAESHWESRTNERYVDNFKRKFAEQEFNAIKRRCRGLNGQKHSCIVTVKKDDRNVKRTVLKSVVGTLDLTMRHFLHGETFPGERIRTPIFGCINRKGPNRYAYISNLCVAKSARRQGIASNMLHFAIESAKSNDVEQVYVHVHRNNKPARELYEKIGFKIVGIGSSQLLDQTDLLCIRAD
ncbi:Acyl-CoA N-acyltransferases (NAT) superfamily protein [Melia azedarach]|uniref:Acyl-CoA N-acyltransferases (NAT) superfamily protein n=1 Tax=Melia azedarach TaxID=155640 RepID=A0ACC1XB50_MELAZ|nr:Acyl-CoA N-acyltransferases (NAT) superfamily protein [Melia azedarach]